MLHIYVPEDSFIQERSYIIQILLKDFLGIEYNLKHEDNLTEVILASNGKSLKINNKFFSICKKKGWLVHETMPSLPLEVLSYPKSLAKKLKKNNVPIIYGNSQFRMEDETISIGIDIFGSSFFMLSRYEEAIITNRDKLDRFPASASIAYKAGFLSRPIVNEYLELLWSCMKELWPGLKRKKRTFRTLVSCDVDTPFDLAYKSFFATGKRITADLVKRQNPFKAAQTLQNYFSIKKMGQQVDPYFKNIYYMADFLESNNLYGAFYFICGNTAGLIDGDYEIITNRHLHKLIKDLDSRGHEVGLHGSYNTYNSEEQLNKEYRTLKQVLKALNIPSTYIGGRQHYLRWETPETANIYNQIGIAYDTTLTYADHAGFRCGTCYEFPLYDLKNRKKLNLIERPLVAMEGTIIQNKYMGLGYGKQALNYLTSLKEQCRVYNGDFTLLWHNSYLNLKKECKLFESIVLA